VVYRQMVFDMKYLHACFKCVTFVWFKNVGHQSSSA